MSTEAELLHIRVHARDAATGVPLADVLRARLLADRDLPHSVDVRDKPYFDPDLFIKPGLGWDVFPWALPDDHRRTSAAVGRVRRALAKAVVEHIRGS